MSLDLSFDSILTVAETIINAIMPIMIWPLGVLFAFGFVAWLVSTLAKFFKFRT